MRRALERARTFVDVVRSHGFREAMTLVTGYLEWRRETMLGSWHDRRYGTDTSGIIELDEVGIPISEDHGHRPRYEAVTPAYFRRMLGSVSIPPGHYVFVDVGCGKGRALLLASDYPFARIVGVELLPQLAETARRNVELYRARTGQPDWFQIVTEDALHFDWPREPLAVYLYNPFGPTTLSRLLDRLGVSLEEHPRDLLVLYRNPTCGWVLDEKPFLRRLKVTPRYRIYVGNATADGATGSAP